MMRKYINFTGSISLLIWNLWAFLIKFQVLYFNFCTIFSHEYLQPMEDDSCTLYRVLPVGFYGTVEPLTCRGVWYGFHIGRYGTRKKWHHFMEVRYTGLKSRPLLLLLPE